MICIVEMQYKTMINIVSFIFVIFLTYFDAQLCIILRSKKNNILSIVFSVSVNKCVLAVQSNFNGKAVILF